MTSGERYKERPLGLSPRQCEYVLNLAQGMSRRGAALAAGYSERVAGNVAHAVEGKRRGRFSMIRRFVQLLRANRHELNRNGRYRDLEATEMNATELEQ
jgi:hypothetical protein